MKLIYRADNLLRKLRRWRERTSRGPVGRFYRDGGVELLLADLPLGSGDLIIDGGGYVGEWTDQILCRYDGRIVVFEPVPLFAKALALRYARNGRVEVQAVALSNRDGHRHIDVTGESTSLFSERGGNVIVPLIDVGAYFERRAWSDIGCLMLNIEGGEYDVIERMIESNLMSRVRCLLVQFHTVAPDAKERRRNIQSVLSETHQVVFDYPFVWERWDLRTVA